MFGRLGVDGLSEDGVTKTKVIDRIRKCKSPTAIFSGQIAFVKP